MNNLGYLFAGFAVVWAVTFAYLWLISRRSAAIQSQLEALERRVQQSAPDR